MKRRTQATLSKFAAALTAAACFALPLAAPAQTEPEPPASQGPPPGAPSYAMPPSYAARGERIQGTIVGFNGQWTVFVRDDRGFNDNISLHQGTIINPTGITLQPGMRVTIYGNANGATFDAFQIDTPYQPFYAGPGWGPSWGGWGWGAAALGWGAWAWGAPGWGWGAPWGWGGWGWGWRAPGWGWGRWGGWGWGWRGTGWRGGGWSGGGWNGGGWRGGTIHGRPPR